MISYIIETLVFQLGFLLLYEWVHKGSTNFQWNRIYLLVSLLFSLLLPLIDVGDIRDLVQMGTESSEWLPTVQILEGVVLTGTSDMGISEVWMGWLWVAGMGVSFILFLYRLIRFWLLIANGHWEFKPGFTLIRLSRSHQAFSFFKFVVIGEDHDSKTRDIILRHEMVHVCKRHTLDILIIEITKIVFWFNPLIWLIEQRLKEIHEFQADYLAAQDNREEYYIALLNQVFQTKDISITHPFFKNSLIKKRISMLQKKKTKNRVIRFIWTVPVILGILLYTSCESEDSKLNSDTDSIATIESVRSPKSLSEIRQDVQEANITEESKTKLNQILEDIEKNEMDIDNMKPDLKRVPFALIDQVPIFPGCEDASDQQACFNSSIITHIKKHFRYPPKALEDSIEGDVALMFLVDEKGKITDIVTRGPDPVLEEEARRIIQKLPEMVPGKQNGKIVAVPYSIPISFRLD